MKQNQESIHLDYFSLLLVLSFIIFHNIYIVWAGILLSIYELNRNLVTNLFKNKINTRTIEDKVEDNKDMSREIKKKKETSLNKDTFISLVETIEEFGYIPSLDKDDNNKAA